MQAHTTLSMAFLWAAGNHVAPLNQTSQRHKRHNAKHRDSGFPATCILVSGSLLSCARQNMQSRQQEAAPTALASNCPCHDGGTPYFVRRMGSVARATVAPRHSGDVMKGIQHAASLMHFTQSANPGLRLPRNLICCCINHPKRRNCRTTPGIIWSGHRGRNSDLIRQKRCFSGFLPKDFQVRQKPPTVLIVSKQPDSKAKRIAATPVRGIVENQAMPRNGRVRMVRKQYRCAVTRSNIQRLLNQRPKE